MQIEKILNHLSSLASAQIAYQHTTIISTHHRVQASQGYRDAAAYCYATLKSYDVSAQIHRYRVDGKATYFSQTMPQEWNCENAVLELLEPESRVLANFQEQKLSIIQRSGATPKEGITTELVLLEDGTSENHYTGIDVKDKFVLTNGNLEEVYRLAVQRYDALGIIHDGMKLIPGVRSEGDLADCWEYRSFWWKEGEAPCVGFNLTPREGGQLRVLLKDRNRTEPVRMKAVVNSQFVANGQMEVVSGRIQGRSDNEIIVMAHLCHPQWMANDNASGVGALLEAARILKRAIQRDALPVPNFTIRFLLVPEFHGLYPYLAENINRIPKIIGGINLDMVGLDQHKTDSSLIHYSLPYSQTSYIDDLLAAIMDDVNVRSQLVGLGKKGPSFRYQQMPFSGGSDHAVFMDPTINIPCVMLNTWPDPYYHTSADTIDKIDPEMLKKSSQIAAAFAYFLAACSDKDAYWLGNEMIYRFKQKVGREVHTSVSRIREDYERDGDFKGMVRQCQLIQNQTDFLVQRLKDSLNGLTKTYLSSLAENELDQWNDEIDRFNHQEILKARAQLFNYLDLEWLPTASERVLSEAEKNLAGIIPKRVSRGLILPDHFVTRLSPVDQERWYSLKRDYADYAYHIAFLSQYWINGERSLLEICDLIELETSERPIHFLQHYYELIEQMGLVQLLRSKLVG